MPTPCSDMIVNMLPHTGPNPRKYLFAGVGEIFEEDGVEMKDNSQYLLFLQGK